MNEDQDQFVVSGNCDKIALGGGTHCHIETWHVGVHWGLLVEGDNNVPFADHSCIS